MKISTYILYLIIIIGVIIWLMFGKSIVIIYVEIVGVLIALMMIIDYFRNKFQRNGK